MWAAIPPQWRFDNMQVTHNRGRIIEENHYYAYGLRIAGISSRKLPDASDGSIKNNYLYNDKELFEEADLNWYDYGFRNYDPQIGRFTQLDPLTDDFSYYTPYQYAGCEPIANVDLDGLEPANVLAAPGAMLKEVTVKSIIPKVASQGVKSAGSAAATTSTQLSSYLFQRAMTEFEIRSFVVNQVYSAINTKIRSREGDFSFRTKAEENVIKSEIGSHVIVDLDNNYATITHPETKEPTIFYTFATKTLSFITNEAQPPLMQYSGAKISQLGILLQRNSAIVESYKTHFNKKFFPKKYAQALKINSSGLKRGGKGATVLGKAFTWAGHALNTLGTGLMWFDVLNAGSPDYFTDDDFRAVTRKGIKAYLTSQ